MKFWSKISVLEDVLVLKRSDEEKSIFPLHPKPFEVSKSRL